MYDELSKNVYSFGGMTMQENKETLIKRFESTAEHYERKGKREYAYAKNDMGGEHYARAKDAFERAKRNREKAERLKKS